MSLRALHAKAMELAELAAFDEARGNRAGSQRRLREAFERESEAARLALSENAPEPTRSILLKSAAHLAVDCGELRQAEKLASTAVAGDPPPEVIDELRQLLDEIRFERHLDLRGIELQPNDLQMVLDGSAIAPGMAPEDEFTRRVNVFHKIVYRTSESDGNIPYREQGNPREEIQKSLQLFVSVPRAASFAVSLRVASASNQGALPFADSAQVLDSVLDRLDMFDREDFESLEHAIPGRDYRRNFMELATDLAPDGKRVTLVGFTGVRGGKQRRVQMKRPVQRDEGLQSFQATDEPLRLKGRVVLINFRDETNPVVQLQAEDGHEWRLKSISKELLNEAVKYALRGKRVGLVARQVSKTTLLVKEMKPIRSDGRRSPRHKTESRVKSGDA